MSLLDPRWKKLDRDCLAELSQRMTIPEIAIELGETPDLVRYALNRYGFKTKRKRLLDRDQVIALRESGLLLHEIAEQFGVSKVAVWYCLNDPKVLGYEIDPEKA